MEKVDLLKKIELEIFIEFKKICDKNNLNYYIPQLFRAFLA